MEHHRFPSCFGNRDTSKGNALFVILIGIVLLGALTLAATQGARTTANMTVSKERAMTDIAQVSRYTGAVRKAINNMRLMNGCTETQISFENPVVAGYTNGSAPGDHRCHVFTPAGGGLTWNTPPPGMNDGSDYEFSSRGQIWGQGETVLTALYRRLDLAVYLRNVTQSHCTAVNDQSGITGIPIDSGDLDVVLFTGAYPVTGADTYDNINGCPAAAPCSLPHDSSPLYGHAYGCFQEEDTGEYIIYSTLLAR